MIKKFSKWLYSKTHKEPNSWTDVANDIHAQHLKAAQMYGGGLATISPNEPEQVHVTSYELQGDIDIGKLRKLVAAYQHSDIVRRANDLDWALSNNQKLQQWEINEVNKVLEKFAAKYKSPLSKAMDS